MKWQAAMLGAVLGCGDDRGPSPDGAPELAVTVLAPNGGETLYAAEEAAVRWTGAASPMAVYDVALVDASGDATPIEAAIAVPAGQPGSTTWTPVGVPAPTRYRIRVTVTIDGRTAVDESDAEFTVSPPAQGVSLAAHLQPIFTARCTGATCHSVESQAAVLTLTPGAAYGALVDVPSRHAACASYRRVLPGQPDQSFLVYKLEGAGPYFAGVRMPKDAPPLPASELQRVRDWIAGGAKNN
jgi:hypothetical protein